MNHVWNVFITVPTMNYKERHQGSFIDLFTAQQWILHSYKMEDFSLEDHEITEEVGRYTFKDKIGGGFIYVHATRDTLMSPKDVATLFNC